jgi:hypothetical protein
MNDEELRARMHASDPAASLPPAAPHEVARLLEDVMATELTTESRQTGTRNRGPLTWLVAAAAVLVIAGVGFFGVRALTGDDATPTAGDPAPSATQLEVSAPAGSAKCMVPNAETLASVDVAFDGTVTAIDGDRVTLAPSKWYAGGPTDVVEVTAPSDRPTDAGLGFEFSAGERYLVSARAGQVSVCGFSAPYSDDLAAIYAEAFPA